MGRSMVGGGGAVTEVAALSQRWQPLSLRVVWVSLELVKSSERSRKKKMKRVLISINFLRSFEEKINFSEVQPNWLFIDTRVSSFASSKGVQTVVSI